MNVALFKPLLALILISNQVVTTQAAVDRTRFYSRQGYAVKFINDSQALVTINTHGKSPIRKYEVRADAGWSVDRLSNLPTAQQKGCMVVYTEEDGLTEGVVYIGDSLTGGGAPLGYTIACSMLSCFFVYCCGRCVKAVCCAEDEGRRPLPPPMALPTQDPNAWRLYVGTRHAN